MDNKINRETGLQIWSARDFKPVKTLAGHESKVAGVDVSSGETFKHVLRFRVFSYRGKKRRSSQGVVWFSFVGCPVPVNCWFVLVVEG